MEGKQIINTILTRRSIRKFSEKVVSDELLEQILECGLAAPSARNQQPASFIVVTNPKTREQISQMRPAWHMQKNCYTSIVVCGDTAKQSREEFLLVDCAAAVENILIAAHGLGLGAVWCGVVSDDPSTDSLKQLLSIPDAIRPVAVIAIGYPDETPSTRSNNKSRIYYEVYKNE